MDWVALAALRRARGIRGEIVAENLGSDLERFVPGLNAALVPALNSERGRPVELERVWTQNGSLVLKFLGIDSRTEAETLQGWFLCIPGKERPALPAGQVYLSDLIGCDVVSSSDGRRIGGITGVQELPGQVLLEVGEDLLIPFVTAICRHVDLETRRIVVDLPEGLEDLNRK